KHGLFFTQRSHPAENGVSVETVLHHEGGEEISLGTLFVPANKQDAQGFGSALTYARRYGLMTAFGVPAEDDDGNAAARSSARAGKVTASRIADLLARTKTGWGASRKNYAAQLVAERLTGTVEPSFCSPAMQWGIDTEAAAREAYCQHMLCSVDEIGFVDHPE